MIKHILDLVFPPTAQSLCPPFITILVIEHEHILSWMHHALLMCLLCSICTKAYELKYHIAGKFGSRGKFGELPLSKHLAKKVWQINRSANRLFNVSTNLDGFNLANHGRFAKFAKLSPRQTFPLYGN